MRRFFQIISWLVTDAIFVNMAFYSAYLIRFNGVIEMNAFTISALSSMSIVYAMRHFWGFMPSSVFTFACIFDVILVSGWRIFVRYED